MKKIGFLFLAVTLFCSVSCEQQFDMLTVVNEDASFYREFSAQANDDFMLGKTRVKKLEKTNNNPFPVDIDSTWTISWIYKNTISGANFPIDSVQLIDLENEFQHNQNSYKTEENGKKNSKNFFVIIKKHFKNVEDLRQNFKFREDISLSEVTVKYDFTKKFNLFYTSFKYRETYPQIELNFSESINNFMTAEEAQFWFNGKPDLLQGMNGLEINEFTKEIEKKFNKWFMKNYWNVVYIEIINDFDKIKNPPVTIQQFKEMKESIFDKFHSKDSDDIESFLNDYFKTKAFSDLSEIIENSGSDFYSQNLKFLDYSFSYKLLMPGKIMQAENAVIKGDTAIWNLTAYRMVLNDFVVEAHSKKINLWAYILSVLIISIAIGSFFFKKGVFGR